MNTNDRETVFTRNARRGSKTLARCNIRQAPANMHKTASVAISQRCRLLPN